MDMSRIIQIHRDVKRNLGDLERAETKWRILQESAFLAEDILENKHSINMKFRSTFWLERKGLLGQTLDQCQWLWFVKVGYHRISLWAWLDIQSFLCLGEGADEVSNRNNPKRTEH